MTERNPAVYIEGASPNTVTQDIRQWMKQVTGGRKGPFAGLSIAAASTPNMTVVVAEGTAMIPGTSNAYQGSYFVENQGTKTLTIGASTSNPRWDLVVAEVKDQAYDGSGLFLWRLRVVAGTAAASPVDPTVPANCIVLARVVVGASVSTITNAAIADLRFSSALGQSLALPGVETLTASTPIALTGAGVANSGFTVPARPYPTKLVVTSALLVFGTDQWEAALRYKGVGVGGTSRGAVVWTGHPTASIDIPAGDTGVLDLYLSRVNGSAGVATYTTPTNNYLQATRHLA